MQLHRLSLYSVASSCTIPPHLSLYQPAPPCLVTHCTALAGLNAINISLDTLKPERFTRLTRRQGHARVLKAIDSAVVLGYSPVKVWSGCGDWDRCWAQGAACDVPFQPSSEHLLELDILGVQTCFSG